MLNSEDKCDEKIKEYSYDEAVELSGHGRYNHLVLVTCSVLSNAVALDMFGFGVVVAASSCDLELDVQLIGLLGSMPFAGLLFAFPWGYFADTRGRRRALLTASVGGFLFASLGSLSPNWQTMMVSKLIGCSFSTATYSLTMAYLGECTGSRHRSEYLFIMNSINLFSEAVTFILAYFLLSLNFNVPLPWLSITYRPWRLLTFLMAVPLGLGALMMYFLHESPKFLANIGKNDKALEVLRSVYRMNGGKEEEYPVKVLSTSPPEEKRASFWESIKKQTVPIFRPPLIWRTLQLFFLLVICCSTNNVFVVWFPTMINAFFTSIANGPVLEQSFCERVIGNDSNLSISKGDLPCTDTISLNTIYTGIVYGVMFTTLNLLVSKLAPWKKIVLITILLISGFSEALVNLPKDPIAGMILFTLLQGTSIGIGIIASYFVDLYPTSYRGMVTSLGLMAARFGSFSGVNLIGAVITDYCSLTFYCWSAFVFSGVMAAFFLPADKKPGR